MTKSGLHKPFVGVEERTSQLTQAFALFSPGWPANSLGYKVQQGCGGAFPSGAAVSPGGHLHGFPMCVWHILEGVSGSFRARSRAVSFRSIFPWETQALQALIEISNGLPRAWNTPAREDLPAAM